MAGTGAGVKKVFASRTFCPHRLLPDRVLAITPAPGVRLAGLDDEENLANEDDLIAIRQSDRRRRVRQAGSTRER
eukprot:SAG22_NODE_1432_length_4436_cov_4.264007_3_plen_75_part_00